MGLAAIQLNHLAAPMKQLQADINADLHAYLVHHLTNTRMMDFHAVHLTFQTLTISARHRKRQTGNRALQTANAKAITASLFTETWMEMVMDARLPQQYAPAYPDIQQTAVTAAVMTILTLIQVWLKTATTE